MAYVQSFAIYLCILLVTLLLIHRSRAAREALVFPRKKLLPQLVCAVALPLVLVTILGTLNVLLYGSFSIFGFLALPPGLLVVFVVFQVLVAATEELLFRGLILSVLEEKLGGAVGILLSAAAFSLLHFITSLSWVSAVVSFVIGLVFAFVKVNLKSCSVYSLMLAHLIYNLAIM